MKWRSAPGVELDETDGKHEYRHAGTVEPGVTTILRDTGLSGPQFYSGGRYPLKLGRAVHAAVHLYLVAKDQRKPAAMIGAWREKLHPDVRPHFEQFVAWEKKEKPIILGSEVRVRHAIPAFCGTLDLGFTLRGHRLPVIADIKTGQPPAWAKWQTAGYQLGLGIPADRATLSLDGGSGPGILIRHESRQDAGQFLAAATTWWAVQNTYGWERMRRKGDGDGDGGTQKV